MKYHFLCEGEKDKGEYQFIERIIEEFKLDESVIFTSSGGNRGLLKKFYEMQEDFTEGDVFTLFFDCVDEINNIDTIDFLLDIDKECKKRGVIFRYTNYYCFEEVFLSYNGLFDLISVNNSLVHEVKLIQKSIMSGTNYFNLGLTYNGVAVNTLYNNRENASASICNMLLSTCKNGFFFLRKNKIGKCWLEDCSNINCYDKKDACTYRCKNCTFRQKIKDLEENSVAKYGRRFSKIFSK